MISHCKRTMLTCILGGFFCLCISPDVHPQGAEPAPGNDPPPTSEDSGTTAEAEPEDAPAPLPADAKAPAGGMGAPPAGGTRPNEPSETLPGTGNGAPTPQATSPDPTEEGKKQKILPRSPEWKAGRVDISAGEIEVLEFIRFLADYTGLPVIIDSTNQQAQQQKILIAAPMKGVTAEIVIALLQANRYLVTRQVLPSGEEILNVVSQQGAVQGPDEPKQNPLLRVDGAKVEEFADVLTSEVTSVRPDEIATMVFTLKYTQPTDAIQSLNSLIGGQKGAKSQAFSIVDVKNSMLVIITAKFGLLNYLAKLLSIIDVPLKEPERIIQIIDIENADADEMMQLIQTFLQGRGSGGRFGGRGLGGTPSPAPGVPGAGGGGRQLTELQTNLIADWRTQKIIVETYSERDLEDIHMLIRELDARFDIRRLKTRIYQVRYLTADEVAGDLQTLIGGAGGGLSGQRGLGGGGRGGGAGGAAGGRRGRSGGVSRVGGRGAGGGIAGPTPGIPGGAGGGGTNAPMPALIVPHVQTNSLIIQAEPEEYAEIINILEQIDVKRRQVFLEAALVEVTSGSQLNYTIELLAGEPNDTATRALFESSFGLSGIDFQEFNRTIPDLSGPASVPPGALVAIMSRGKFPALVRFFKTNTDTQVLATPFIIADDNQSNTLDITETRYVQNTNVAGGAAGVTTTSNEGEDAGITLDITPTISSQSAVFLEMSLEVSQFQQGGTAQVLPPKTTNSVTSAVTIPDGEIFVIGGLTRENQAKAVSKVPILGDIPLLGKLFRSETTSRSISNLYIFLRAHVLIHPEFKDGIELAKNAQEQVEKFAPHMNIVRFSAPQVPIPPPKETDLDAPKRFETRSRSRFPEGYEAPLGPYEKQPHKSEEPSPTLYQGDPESPGNEGGMGAATPPTQTPGLKVREPQPRQDVPVEPATKQPTQVKSAPEPDTAMPPLVRPPTTSEEQELDNPAALEGTGMELDPDGSSWLLPLKPKKQ